MWLRKYPTPLPLINIAHNSLSAINVDRELLITCLPGVHFNHILHNVFVSSVIKCSSCVIVSFSITFSSAFLIYSRATALHFNPIFHGVILSSSYAGGGFLAPHRKPTLTLNFLAKFGLCIGLSMNLKFQF